jgi:oxygen-independent coproporphyrinogen-3 oxidase
MIYVHVPFCRSFCTYCDFYSEIAARQEALFERYAEALVAEIGVRKDEIAGVCADNGIHTLYVGGGTPSVLPLDFFRRLLDGLGQAGVQLDFDEFTVEVNPEDVVEKGETYIKGLLELGVNRISMGVQSFDDKVLRWMNRRHSSETAVKAYRILESAGVENISIDLIFGLPQVSASLWRETIEKALNISAGGKKPCHISSYQLSVEPGSALACMVEKELWREADDEVCREQYSILCESLVQAGYHHYEISNFALPGYEAVHNSAYWRHVPYIGLGPGAHSFVKSASDSNKDNVRCWNDQNLESYLEAAGRGDFGDVSGSEVLDGGQIALEKIMLGLRTSEGIEAEYLMEYGDREAVLAELEAGHLIKVAGGKIRIPESQFFVSDNIIASLV